MILMRINDFIRELFCRHEWEPIDYGFRGNYEKRYSTDSMICLKCGKIR